MGHTDDSIPGLQAAFEVGRAAGNDALNQGVFVVALQHRADTLQRQTHANLEVLGRARRKIACVRFDRRYVGIDQCLKDVFAGYLFGASPDLLVTLVQGAHDLGIFLASYLQSEVVVFNPPAPEVVEFNYVHCPRRLAAVESVVLIDGKIKPLLQ